VADVAGEVEAAAGEVTAGVAVAAKVCLEARDMREGLEDRGNRSQCLCYSLAKGISGNLLDNSISRP
jgi:hypothetical protein